MTARLRALFAGAALVLPFSAFGPAHAQGPQDAPTVEEVIVTGRRDREEPPVVADARARLSETPGAVAVVSAEAYETRYAPTLADSLRDVAGVYAQKKWGEDIRLSIRGSGIGNNNHNRGLLLAQDGVPFNEADGYGDFQLIDPLTARYTEVYKGGNALRFGGAMLGGAVNLVTPTGRTAGLKNLVRLEGGSFDTWRAHGEIARVFGDWDAFGALTLIDAEGFRDHSATSSARASLNVGRQFGEDRSVRLYLTGGDVVQEIPGALAIADALVPGANATPNALKTPWASLPANREGALHSQRNVISARTSLQTRWRLSEGAVFEGGAYAIWKDLDHPIFQIIDQQGRNYGVFGRIYWEGEIGGLQADAFYGAWHRWGDLDARQWVNLNSNRGALTAFSQQNSDATDLFAEGRLWVTESVALVAGGTYGATQREYVRIQGGAPSAKRNFDWLAPRIGLLWQGSTGIQVYANLTRSVEPPNMSALAQVGPPPTLTPVFSKVDPQQATTAELGARGRSGAFTWDFATYRANIDKELLTFTPGPNIPAASFNAEDTVHQGIEASLDWRFADRWRLRQTYTWQDFYFATDVVPGDGLAGKRLPIAPEHLYRAELKYSHPSGWFIAPSLEWVPEGPFVDYRNTLVSPDYAIWSLNAGFDVREGVRLFVDARNLTDEVHISNVNAVVNAGGDPRTASFWPGDGRSVFVGLSAEF